MVTWIDSVFLYVPTVGEDIDFDNLDVESLGDKQKLSIAEKRLQLSSLSIQEPLPCRCVQLVVGKLVLFALIPTFFLVLVCFHSL